MTEPSDSPASPKRSIADWCVLSLPTILVILALAVGVGTTILKRLRQPAEADTVVGTYVGVETVTRRTFSETRILPGRLLADNEVVISSELGGRVSEWLVAEGGAVTAGKPVARLDVALLAARRTELQATLKRVRAMVAAEEEGVKTARLTVGISKREKMTAHNNWLIAKGDAKVAQSERIRAEKLFKQGVRTESDMDRIRNDADRAQAVVANAENAKASASDQVASTQSAVTRAEAGRMAAEARVAELEAGITFVTLQIEKSTIMASISGVLDKYLKEVGEVVTPGEPMGHVFDTAYIRVKVDMSDRYVPFLNDASPLVKEYVERNFPGAIQKIETTLLIPGLPKLGGGRSDDVKIPAKIARIGQSADTLSNTFEVELRAVNPGGIFKQGMLVRTMIKVLEYPDAILIPMNALRVTEFGPRCMVAIEKEGGYRAESRTIEARSVQGNTVLVFGDLKPGELLITSNVQELLDGEKIVIIKKDGVPTSDRK